MKQTDNLILGKNCVYSTDPDETGLNNNVIVCGTSGCGKTMSITEPRLLEANNTSLVVTVTKRKIVEKFKPILRDRGYVVWDLDLVHPGHSTVGYNPLALIRNSRDIAFLAESLEKGGPEGQNLQDPYWDNSAISLLSAEIGLVLETEEHPTFADFLKVHSRLNLQEFGMGIRTGLDEDFEELEKCSPKSPALACWKTFRCLPMKTASCVFATLNTAIDYAFSPEMEKLFSKKPMVDFRKLASKKTVLFITTSPVNPSLQSFINVFYGQLFKQLFEFAERIPGGALPVPVQVVCDDFATGGRIASFPEHISIFREKGISVILLLQSESQLEAMYGQGNATTIINNCDTYVYMGGMDLTTANHISLRMNEPINDVLELEVGREYIFRRGQKPRRTVRYNILDDERYLEIDRIYKKKIEADTLER